MKKRNFWLNKSKLLKPLIAFYFFIAVIEIVAELYKDFFYISITKPLLMPLLIGVYWFSSTVKNKYFLLALFAAWFANLFFISSSISFIIFGTIFFLFYRVLVIYLVMNIIRFPGYIPMIIGSLPFLFIYLFVANIAYVELGNLFYLFIFQALFMIFFGSLCLGNYIIKPNKSNTLLLISTMLFTVTQFILVLKIFYLNSSVFQPLAMLLYVVGQYLLYRFVIIEEKKKKRYQIINKINSSK